ncbi:MAG: response regulator [Candidatus Hydrogenedentes bacterium]|nr:response regulator [Candidatus Hydrogenedentota bacterium]
MVLENSLGSDGGGDSSRLVPPKVLVVDDEEDVLRLIKDALEMEGIEVVTAFDGLSGLDVANRELPDVVILDIMMPLMNGYEVCKQLRDNDRTGDIPVLFLSSAYTTDAVQASKDLGAVGYIVKPFAPSELITAVKDVIESTRSENG